MVNDGLVRKSGGVDHEPLARELWNQLLGMALMLVFLFLVSYVSVVGNLFVVVSLFSILWVVTAKSFFWAAKRKRALVLHAYFRDESPWAARLSGGPLMLSVCFVVGVVAALGLFIPLSQGMGKAASLALVVGIGGLLFINYRARKAAAKHLRSVVEIYGAARLSFWLVSISLLVCVSIASFWIPVPDLSNLSFHDALLWGYTQAQGEDELLRRVAGIWTMADAARIWLVEQVSVGGWNVGWKCVAWLVVLVQQFLFIFPALFLIQWAGLAAERFETNRHSEQTRNKIPAVLTPVLGLIGAAVLAVFLWNQLVPAPWARFTGKIMLVRMGGHTYQASPDEFDEVIMKAFNRLDRASQQAFIKIDDEVGNKLDHIFQPALDNVPAYADWYYSLTGEVERVASVLPIYDVGGTAMQMLFPEHNLDAQLSRLSEHIGQKYADAQQMLETQFVADMKQLLEPFETHPHRQYEAVASPLNLQLAYSNYLSDMLGTDKARMRLGVAGATAAATLLAPKAIGAAAKSAKTRAARRAQTVGRTGQSAETTSTMGKMANTVTRPVKKIYAAAKTWAANKKIIGPVARSTSKAVGKAAEKIGATGIAKVGTAAVSQVGTRTVALFGAERVLGTVAAASVCSAVPVIGTVGCGVAAFVGMTAVTEKGLLELDEYNNRDAFERELSNRINGIREKVERQYRLKLLNMLKTNEQTLRDSIMAQVRPVDLVL